MNSLLLSVVILSSAFDSTPGRCSLRHGGTENEIANGLKCMSGTTGAYYSQSNCSVCQKSVLSTGGGTYGYCASSCTEGTSPISTSMSITTYCCKTDLCNVAPTTQPPSATIFIGFHLLLAAMAAVRISKLNELTLYY